MLLSLYSPSSVCVVFPAVCGVGIPWQRSHFASFDEVQSASRALIRALQTERDMLSEQLEQAKDEAARGVAPSALADEFTLHTSPPPSTSAVISPPIVISTSAAPSSLLPILSTHAGSRHSSIASSVTSGAVSPALSSSSTTPRTEAAAGATQGLNSSLPAISSIAAHSDVIEFERTMLARVEALQASSVCVCSCARSLPHVAFCRVFVCLKNRRFLSIDANACFYV